MQNNSVQGYKPFRVALQSIRREFKRCSYLYPPLFHEHFLTVADFSNCSTRKVLKAFQDRYAERFGNEWGEWHAPSNLSCFGRFTGTPDGLDEFQRLAESGYLILCELNPWLPEGDGFHGWMKVIHEMAHAYPTPLLRSSFTVWEQTDLLDDDDDPEGYFTAFGETEEGTRYPLHPYYWKLSHNVVTSSMTAIDLILDEDAALLVGDHTWEFPMAFPHLGEPDETSEPETREEESAPVMERSGTETSTDTSLICELLRHEDRWTLRYGIGEHIEEAWPSDMNGLNLYACLLKNPEKHFQSMQLEQEARLVDELVEDSMGEDPDVRDPEPLRHINEGLAKLQSDLDKTSDPNKRKGLQEQLLELKTYEKKHLGLKGKIKNSAVVSEKERARKRVWGSLKRARKEIEAKLPTAAIYLKNTVDFIGGAWIYRPRSFHEEQFRKPL
jgi:hypothetical protein